MASQSSAAASAPREREAMVGKFRRLESIGKGSFAVVYKAIHPADQSLVAIKTVQHVSLKGKLKQNLFSEIDILKRIHHPHIVALINILESANHIHLVMEFCQLGDLATFIKKRDKLAAHPVTADMIRKYPNPPNAGFNEVVVRHYAQQLSAALKFMRAKDLVHRDLKPQNLLLNPPPSYIAQEPPESRPYQVAKNSLIPEAGIESLPQLKIADFGFARYLPTTTMAETLCGSPLYMAPEILSYQKYDAKADLWSVGTVLYELMVGKPPFRAANHVDLLRKIERTQDNVRFPDDLVISPDMYRLIRGLLKKSPTERMSWDEFFASPVNVNQIPGLVGADRKDEVRRPPPESRESAGRARNGSIAESPVEDHPDQIQQEPLVTRTPTATPITVETRPSRERLSRGTPPPATSSPLNRRLSGASPRSEQRPSFDAPSATSATQRAKPTPHSAFERRRSSQQATSPGSPAPRDLADVERPSPKTQERMARELREKAAHDMTFERDYVVVERRAVEVNAFADELANSPRIQQPASRDQAGVMARRATTQALTSTSAPSGRGVSTANRPDGGHQRQGSYERRYAPSRASAQSAIAAALNMVNWRLYGGPLAAAGFGKSPSPPQPYGPFPAFPATQTAPLLLIDAGPRPHSGDEDTRVVTAIEESATRSDVVYGFAEVKYKQLIPIMPSQDNALGIRRPGAATGAATPGDIEDDDLTPDAVVGISEEALVLYVKALAILTNTINTAGYWWNIKNKPDVSAADRTSLANAGTRINHVVQWARNRFNECLEKSEYVSRRLTDAQEKLPESHAGHPKNHPRTSSMTQQHRDLSGSQIFLTSGITAEKLMYDRALDMSRTAAVNELVGEDLPGCEVSYLTAIRLLEAVLEDVEDVGNSQGSSKRSRGKQIKGEDSATPAEDIDESDEVAVRKVIEGIKGRLTSLRRKLSSQASTRKPMQRHSSGPVDPSASLVSTSAPSSSEVRPGRR